MSVRSRPASAATDRPVASPQHFDPTTEWNWTRGPPASSIMDERSLNRAKKVNFSGPERHLPWPQAHYCKSKHWPSLARTLARPWEIDSASLSLPTGAYRQRPPQAAADPRWNPSSKGFGTRLDRGEGILKGPAFFYPGCAQTLQHGALEVLKPLEPFLPEL